MPDITDCKALADRYYNTAGAISCQFVIKFKKLTPEMQAMVNAELAARGLPPYDLNAKKTRKRKSPAPTTAPVANNRGEQDLVTAIAELQIDKAILKRFLSDMDAAEGRLREQLCELQGVPYVPEVKDDQFEQIYKPAHNHARHNRDELTASEKCGCFFCRATYSPKAILDWAEGGLTAICPNCGIDSVIGDKAGYDLTDEFLQNMFRHWFSVPLRLMKAKEGAVEQEVEVIASGGGFKQRSPLLTNRSADWQPDEDEPPRAQDRFFGEEGEVPAGIGAGLMASLPEDPEPEEDE